MAEWILKSHLTFHQQIIIHCFITRLSTRFILLNLKGMLKKKKKEIKRKYGL